MYLTIDERLINFLLKKFDKINEIRFFTVNSEEMPENGIQMPNSLNNIQALFYTQLKKRNGLNQSITVIFDFLAKKNSVFKRIFFILFQIRCDHIPNGS